MTRRPDPESMKRNKRRLQNREAQRRYRRREAEKASVERHSKASDTQNSFQVVKWRASNGADVCPTPVLPCGGHMNPAGLSLSCDQLLVVAHNNIIRGLVTIANLMELPWSSICQDNVTSPFCSSLGQPDAVRAGCISSCQALRPTHAQIRVQHHPWIDLIPSIAFRDNVLAAIERVWTKQPGRETELCEDLTGAGDLAIRTGRPGMMVWGDPWDVESWEISQEFAQKWPKMLEGCRDLVMASNSWRRSRGGPTLQRA